MKAINTYNHEINYSQDVKVKPKYKSFCLLTLFFFLSQSPLYAGSNNLTLKGTVAYQIDNNAVNLYAEEVVNNAPDGHSGTLRLELWAFLQPYTGSSLTGYKLAQYRLDPLLGGFHYSNVDVIVPLLSVPPDGSWQTTMMLTEYNSAFLNDGFETVSWVNFSTPLVIGDIVSVPDDHAGSRNSATIFPLNSSVQGSLGIGDSDYFVITTNTAGILTIYKTGIHSLLEVQNSTGSISNTITSSSMQLNMSMQAGSRYYVRVAEIGGSVGTYTLRNEFKPNNPAQENSIVTAVEYYHPEFNHYFMTAFPSEIQSLDNSTTTKWKRTGYSFLVDAKTSASTRPVCRFFSNKFAPKSSHFYTHNQNECASIKTGNTWSYEGNAFYVVPSNSLGQCPSGTRILYRLYNNGMSGAPNHRYTVDKNTWQQMQEAGWVQEGHGITGAFACVPS